MCDRHLEVPPLYFFSPLEDETLGLFREQIKCDGPKREGRFETGPFETIQPRYEQERAQMITTLEKVGIDFSQVQLGTAEFGPPAVRREAGCVRVGQVDSYFFLAIHPQIVAAKRRKRGHGWVNMRKSEPTAVPRCASRKCRKDR